MRSEMELDSSSGRSMIRSWASFEFKRSEKRLSCHERNLL